MQSNISYLNGNQHPVPQIQNQSDYYNTINFDDNYENMYDINNNDYYPMELYQAQELPNENYSQPITEPTFPIANNSIQHNAISNDQNPTHMVLNISSKKGDFVFLNSILKLIDKNNVPFEIYSAINDVNDMSITQKPKKIYFKIHK